MGKTVYLECYSGISGDMTAAALLDLGADKDVLMRALKSLSVQGFEVKINRVLKSGIDACDFQVVLDEKHENHDHDMEYLYGHEHEHDHEHSHSHEHEHDHDHSHSHEHEHDHDHSHSHEHEHDHEHSHSHEHEHSHEHSHSHEHEHDHEHSHSHEHHEHGHEHTHSHTHEHRGMKEIRDIIHQADMTENAKAIALKIFTILAEAEAKAHNRPVDEVHFHEVGAIDSIVDILSVAVCLDNLEIENAVIPSLCEGVGTVRCQHGILPVPVPAVANIAQAHHLNLRIVNTEGELVTPTGAAIAAAIKTSEVLPEEFTIQNIGIGAGKRKYERPGILRAMLIQEKSEETDTIYKLESNIDDCSGEALGYVMEKLFAEGARDVHYTPVFMKKNRPAWQLNVICKEEDVEKLEQIIFCETTTIGIRRMKMERSILKREQRQVETSLGTAEVKVCMIGNEMRFYPEYESVVALCKQHQLPYLTVYNEILAQCKF